MTLESLADLVGVSVGHLSRVERRGAGSLKLALRLAQVTGMPVTVFAPADATPEAA